MADPAAPEVTQTNPAPATPPAPTTQAPPPETTSPVLQKLADAGFQDVKSAEEGLERVLTAYQRQGQEFGDKLKAAIEEVRGSAPPPVVAPPPPPTGKPWDIPPIDLHLVQQFRTPEGQWKPETPAAVRQQAEAYQSAVTNWTNLVATNPAAALGPLIEERSKAIAEKLLAEREASQREEQTLQKVTAENPWVYEVNPVTGKPDTNRLSAEGQRMDAWMKEAADWGANFSQQWQYAIEKRELEQLRSKFKQPDPAQATAANDQQKQTLLQRAAPGLSRAGSLPTPGTTPPRNTNLGPGQKFLQQLQADGAGINR